MLSIRITKKIIAILRQVHPWKYSNTWEKTKWIKSRAWAIIIRERVIEN